MDLRTLLCLAVLLISASCSSAVEGVVKKIALTKNTANTLSRVQNKLAALKSLATSGNVTLQNYQDLYYCGTISIGTPGQQLTVDFDTGSSDLWIYSRDICQLYPTLCNNHNTYSHSSSSSYVSNGKSFAIKYGSGDVSGYVSEDTVEVAGISVTGQIFGEATAADSSTRESEFDGLLGLAYPALSSIQTEPPFVNMIFQDLVDEPVFAFYLNSYQGSVAVGELVLGGTDPDHYTGSITYTPVVSKNYWTISISEIAARAYPLTSSSVRAIPDSGTSFIYGPTSIINLINGFFPGYVEDGIKVVTCSSISNFPNIIFTIGGRDFVLTSEDYIYKENGYCVSTFVATDSFPFMILGDVFMRKFYTVFDMGNNRVGFATAASSPEATTESHLPSSAGPSVSFLSWMMLLPIVWSTATLQL